MFAALLMVRISICECVPSSVTLVGLKLQAVPAGKPVQLLEVKLTVCVELFTGATVRVTEADCPAGIDAGDAVPAPSVKSGWMTVTVTAEDVEGALIPL
jgi:hypothetical protein